jgi:CheY-like chemotaxis protein
MRKARILIVEDESLIALQLKLKLGGMGYDVCEPARRGEDAIAAARSDDPDFILMDIGLMGDMDGIEAARRIGGFSPARIIFTTGHLDPDTESRALALHPAAFLPKPIDALDLQSLLLASGSLD